uniref:G_PROTEIN_RECEP_F2_4 domain-containing protein n=1 Tax=Steinernema glaseri TaxID=37863 RepID=A0A1I7ZBG1_9BILA
MSFCGPTVDSPTCFMVIVPVWAVSVLLFVASLFSFCYYVKKRNESRRLKQLIYVTLVWIVSVLIGMCIAGFLRTNDHGFIYAGIPGSMAIGYGIGTCVPSMMQELAKEETEEDQRIMIVA